MTAIMLQLKAIGIRRFKGIVNTVIDLDQNLNLFIGPNGTGKSTILQAFSFIRSFATGEIEKLFDDRNWLPEDLKPKGSKGKSAPVAFDILLSDGDEKRYVWQIRWNANTGRTQQERLWYIREGEDLAEVFNFDAKRGLSVANEIDPDFLKRMRLTSSLLQMFVFADDDSGFNSDEVFHWAESILSLELLSTTELRRNSRTGDEPFGLRGERFSAYLYDLGPDALANIVSRVNRFYPIGKIHLKKKRAGWVEMSITDARGGFEINSNHISDGVLRMIAFSSLPESNGRFSIILVDEVEDGIEPHNLKELVEDLRTQVGCQVLATSHSPIIANYVKLKEVKMVWRDDEANIYAVPVENLRVFQDEYLGIGEAWLNASTKAIDRNIRNQRLTTDYPIGDRASDWRTEVEEFLISREAV